MRRFIPILLACWMAAAAAAPAPPVRIDGRPDEPAWADAQVFGDFVVTEPYTLAAPAHPTEARLLATPQGIAIAFRATQPPGVPRLRERTPRDADIPGDRVNVFIDFNGERKVAYNFTIGLSGALQDATWTNEVAYSPDWDGEWQAAVAEDEAGWTAEFLLPWSVAPMAGSGTPRRTIAVLFDRVLGATAERSASAPASFTRPRFVSDFPQVEIDQYQASVLDLFPYATLAHDLIDGGNDGKAGLDVFWKPSGDFQLTAALNPDFGQVEADELVVNFDAVEVFFSDKRPFFTENQSLFDLRTPDDGQLVYTRRIGGPRDDQPGRAAEIDAALKVTGSARGFNWGTLAAVESDHADDLGSLFVAQRVVRPGEVLSLGWIGTWTERPFLDREALVNAVDLTWRPGPTVLVAAQAIGSDVRSPRGDRDGSGGWFRVDLTPSASLRHQLEVTHFGAALDFNDIGFQRRASLNEAEWTTALQQTGFSEDHWLRGLEWYGEVQYRSNDRGDRLPVVLIPELRLQHASGARTLFSLFLESSGFDDLISRGNGLLRREAEGSFLIEHETARIGDFQFDGFLNPFRTSFDDDGFAVGAGLSWLPREDFNLELDGEWLRTDAWLLWERDRLFGTFDRQRATMELDANWFPAEGHELRLKLQWLAIDTADPRAFELGADARLRPSALPVEAFSINNFGVQLRYRWTFAPQSDLYVVYSRGGFSEHSADPRGVGDLFQDAFSLRDADQFLVKVRYRL
jgi:hypothetical protein